MEQFTLRDRLDHRPGHDFVGYERPRSGSVITASLIAGVVFVLLQAGLSVAIYRESPWTLFHMINAMAMGPETIEPRDAFELGPIVVASAIHFVLAMIYGAVLTHVLSEFSTTTTTALVGVVFGLLLYLVNFHGFTGLFPWFVELRGGVTIVSHAIFGLTLAMGYTALEARRKRAAPAS